MKIVIASDHRGHSLKDNVVIMVAELGHEPIDFGCFDEIPVDYPDMAYAAAIEIIENRADRAILVCSTGMGMCLAANKVKGIKAVTCYDELSARISRTHLNSNALCLPGDLLSSKELKKIIDVWLHTEFLGGRHARRLKKVQAIEEGKDPRAINKKSNFVTV